MSTRLFVDDLRPFPEMGYECCRNADDAITLLSAINFQHISLDYDLGYGCKTGLDILIWMKKNNVSVPEINIHSSHVFGRQKMLDFCKHNFPETKVTAKTLY